MPLLPGIAGDAATFDSYGEGGLAVRWRLANGGRLHLCANLGGSPLDNAPTVPEGRLLAMVGATAGGGMAQALSSGRWPAWSVAWLLSSES